MQPMPVGASTPAGLAAIIFDGFPTTGSIHIVSPGYFIQGDRVAIRETLIRVDT